MTRRKLATTLLVATMAAGMAAYAEEKQAETKKQTTCPVMGGKINKAQYVDANGKRIYVCCGGCVGKVKADPGKYIQQMEAKGITLEATPK
jgi:hypothetical protein